MNEPDAKARRDLAVAIHAAAVAGVDPRAATRTAVSARLPDAAAGTPVWIIALGKASHAMAEAAIEVLQSQGIEPRGGIIVAPDAAAPPPARLDAAVGDHPVPGSQSREAAELLGSLTERIAASVRDATVFVLLSGGATSLIAAPVASVSDRDLTWMFDALLTSGTDITTMNAIRKRFSLALPP